MRESTTDVNSDIQLLYELSLSIGTSLDLNEACKAFLDVLMARKELSFCSVWIISSQIYSDTCAHNYELVYAYPAARADVRQIPIDHHCFDFEEGEHWRRYSFGDDGFDDVVNENNIVGGCYALFELPGIGIVKLYRSTGDGFPDRELNQLRTVFGKFAVSLNGALSHLRLLTESSRRRATQVSLQQQKSLLRSLIDSVPDLIFYKDQDGVYLGCNEAFEQYANLRESELIGLSDFDMFDQDTAASFRSNDVQMMSTGESRRNEEWITYSDGRKVLLDTLKTPYCGPDGEILGLIGISRDITVQKTTEHALQRAQKMEAIGQLTGGIAHDFNNILGVILGNVNLLWQKGIDDETVKRRIQTIDKSAHRAADLTKQLLGFSRQRPARSQRCNINRLIDDMNSLISRSLTPEIEVVNLLADDLWKTKIDPGDFQDAILNLVLNAHDAIEGSGRLIIQTENETVDDDRLKHLDIESGDYVHLSISDTGIGISDETYDHVFEPFFTTKSMGKGTGLGLSMVYGFVTRSAGFIDLDTQLGVGSAFHIYLPRSVSRGEAAKHHDDYKEKLPHGTETILIVDDEEMLLMVADDLLSNLGYKTILAGNGNEALLALKEHEEVDLVFSDVVMPGGMNGFELVGKVHEQYPDVKVLLTSGFAEKDTPGRSESNYSGDLLVKPYNLADLAGKVRTSLDAADQMITSR